MVAKWVSKVSLLLVLSLVVPWGANAETRDELLEEKLFRAYAKVVEDSPSEKSGLTQAEATKLFNSALHHPVANLEEATLLKYDPKGIIGFCFGRAATVHLIARRMGLKETSIRKLFVAGDLRSNPEKPEWRFHVTTLIKGTNNQWYAIDPIMTPPLAPGGPIPVAKWISIVKDTWDYKNAAHFYVTQANAITPDIRVDADGKSGKHLIELAFAPEKDRGFKRVEFGKFDVYVPSQEAQAIHFLEPSEKSTDNRFLFLSITVEGLGKISFNDYFVDLLKSFSSREPNGARALAQSAATESVAAPKAVENRTRSLHSFKLGK